VTLAGLTNGTPYVFRVAAVTSFAQGQFSAVSAVVTPQAPAPAPTRLTPAAGNGAVSLAWVAPRLPIGARITDYAVQYSTNGGMTWTTASEGVSAATRTVIGGLTNGTAYVFRVAAVVNGNTGLFSTATAPVMPFSRSATPAAPTALIGVGGGGVVSHTWTGSPANAGGPVRDYVIQYRLAGSNRWLTVNDGVSGATSATIRRLSVGRSYIFRVAAKNLAGQGLFSAESAPILA
jgi:hypothetical protein